MSEASASDRDFEQRLSRVEGLLTELSASPDPRVERVTREILAAILELHRRGLARMLAACDERARGDFAQDTSVNAMLLLHDLHPLPLDARVSRAADGLRQRFRGKIEDVIAHARGGHVTLRVVPTNGSCGSTRSALKKECEEALLTAAPDAESISIELAEPPAALVQLRIHRSADGERRNGGQQ